jgi:hypothetical protein
MAVVAEQRPAPSRVPVMLVERADFPSIALDDLSTRCKDTV